MITEALGYPSEALAPQSLAAESGLRGPTVRTIIKNIENLQGDWRLSILFHARKPKNLFTKKQETTIDIDTRSDTGWSVLGQDTMQYEKKHFLKRIFSYSIQRS